MKNLLLIFLLFTGSLLYSQCTINAGGNTTICGTAATLQGTAGTGNTGSPTWTLVSKPSGAPNPVITGANTLTPNVTGMTFPGNYVFQVEQNCTLGGSVTSQVTIAAPGATTGFTAGPDITNIPATTGIANLSATIPAGYTPSWTYYNINSFEVNGAIVLTNATMTGTTTATPTLTLTKKADHDIDPSYRVILRITSTVNPSCWYEDDAIVRFVPNPNVSFPNSRSFCGTPSVTASNRYFYDDNLSSPKFSDATTNASANPSWGTTITMNVISQPSGGNLAYGRIQNGRLYFASSFNQTVGAYVFTLTISNSSGSYTTQQLTFNYNGSTPGPVSFVDAAYPEQMAAYSAGSTGGAVYCNRAGTTTPITFYFKLDPTDSPTLTSTVIPYGVIPTGGAPSIVENGAGSLNRSTTLTPPSGGWRVGTYSFSVTLSNGTCNRAFFYYVHISDGNRPDVAVNNLTVCYPGSGVVSATIPLPAVYKGVVNPSYFQDYGGRYDLTVVSKPAGSATPTFDPVALRTFTNTSTVISNLNTQGEYVFKIKATPPNGGDPGFIAKEYACSGTLDEDTFSVFVSAQVGANAGSAQALIGATQTTFNANNPGAATGAWALLTKPVGATDPVIATPSAYNTNVTGFNSQGTYTFRWTVTTGTCTSTSDLTVNVINATAGGVSGADFWVKSDDAGTIATAWKDHSANANNIPNVGGITLSPADRAHNFHPYTSGYTGSKFFYNSASAMNPLGNVELANTNTSIFSAVRPTTANGTGRITGIDDDTNAAEPGISIASGRPRQYEFFASTTSSDFSSDFNVGQSNIFSALANNTVANGGTSAIAGGEKRLGLNGSYESFSGFAAANRFQIYGTNLRIGQAGWDAGGPFPGDIMEILWFKRALTANEQSRVNSYLAVKNGVTLAENYLATNSSIVWDRTNNAGYNNNIFGIARDNITALHQKQSGSVNSGQKLVISTTGFADSNAANSTGLANDLQFLLTGDNGLKQSLTTPLSYTAGSNGITNYRFESIWKVQNTNTVGNVTVAWPKGVTNLYLVQSTDAVFDGTDTFTPMTTEVTVNGVVYNTATVTLGNGQFYTFAGFAQAPGGVVGPDFWVKSDDAGTISTAWKDNSINADNIPNVGGIALSPADRSHNFHPYTSGYTGTKFFYNAASVMNPLGNVELANTNTSVFSAVRPTTVNGTGRIVGIDDDATLAAEPGFSIASGRPRQYEFFATETFSDFSVDFNVGQSNIFSALANNTVANGGTSAIAGGEKRLGLNGSYESFSGFAPANRFQIYGTNLRIGQAGWNAAGPFPGDIMEIAWYNRTLTANEQSRVNSYLAVKNGVTLNENYLSTNSAVVWDRTNNAGYNNNIFGIAKDDFTALHQKQAGSVNSGQQLVISTTGFANSNAANSTGLANDLQFLLTGDNGLKQSLTTPLSYTAGSNGIANYRFESIWKVQNTNAVSTVTVAWPKGVKNLYLVQSPDAVFDGTDTFTPMTTEVTVNGVVYNTVNVTLANGQFYTFAGFGNAPGGVATSLSYWYRADKNATNTGATTDVTGWTDMWNGTTVAQLGTNALPKFVLGTSAYFNFNPGINFTAGTQTLGNNTVRTLTSLDYDVFTFTKEGLASGGAFGRLFSVGMDNTTTGAANWDAFGIWPATTDLERRPYGGITQYPNVSPAFSATIPSIMYFKNTNTNTSKGLNGALLQTPTNYSAVGNQFGGHIFGSTLFSGNGSDNPGFIGHIGETIVYGAGTLSNTERRRVDSYLAIKYGITLGQVATDHYLDTDGNVVWNGADNTAFNSNIFGVGRDDIEVFEQKVSKSVNAGTILTIATINDFVLQNLDASRTGFTNDKTYFLLGDNANAATTPIDVSLGSKTYRRIPKIWMTQEKNTDAGSLFFEADLTAYNSGTFVTTGGKVVMLISDDAAFTTNVVVVDATVNNAAKWVYSQNIASGKYITFAVDPCYGLDSDGDGVADMCDLDDDNDGILDTAECPTSYNDFIAAYGAGTTTNIVPSDFGLALNAKNQNVTRDLSAKFGFPANSGAVIISITNASVHPTSDIWWTKNGQQPSNWQVSGTMSAFVGMAHDLQYYANDSKTIHIYDNANVIPVTVAGNANQTAVAGQWSITDTQSQKTLTNLNANSGTIESGNWRYINMNFGPKSFGFSTTVATAEPNYAVFMLLECDTDLDGIPNRLDLDSDNDGCLDALEGSANFAAADLVSAGGTVTVGFGSSALNQNLCGGTICVGANGIPTVAGTGQGAGSSQNALISSCQAACYKPGITTGTALDTKVGITALNRAGATDSDNWPMTRKGGWLALEAKTKGFVPNRVAFDASGNPIGISLTNFVEGMMVYDTTNKCLKMYTLKDGDTSMAWHCISTQTCPD